MKSRLQSRILAVAVAVTIFAAHGLESPVALAAQDAPTAPAGAPRQSIRVHLFVDDARQAQRTDWQLAVTCGTVPVDVEWIGPNEARIGAVTGKCTLRFSAEGQEAIFPDFGSHLLTAGGELVVAFLTDPALLENDVVVGDQGSLARDARSCYDDARASVCEAWRRATLEQQKRTLRVAFYNFVPDVTGDPIEITGYYFVLSG